MKMPDLSKLNELDFKDIGNWPVAGRAIVIVLMFGALLFAGYWFHNKDQLVELDSAKARESGLKQTFESKQSKAANLQLYKEQLEVMKQSFGAMLRQLPDKTEVADLLVDVSQTGLANGLEFELFKPSGEQPREFYAELPIELRVVGTYHEFGGFVSGLAALPRIVTIHDITITPDEKDSTRLAMQATAKTYRYLEEETK
ncbi:MAG: pilus assembly protein PilO [Proteobacteria bacterium]|nr:MAG: pilus assembly protein PilO [Pseudomonadota bacterium]QKK10902.1 MAG: type 4a pilus biogenesis protein PilO [Pseudomonadota bacterium]